MKGEGNGIKFFEEGSGAHQRFPNFYSLENGALLYPSKHNITSNKWGLNGCGGTYTVIPIQIPNGCQSLENFVELVSLNENDFAGAFYEQNTNS